MKKLGCPESFTEPVELYYLALQRGMTNVTITDHNVIDGCLAISHLPNTFISGEYSTYFPENKCKIHVLIYDINEKQHNEVNDVRQNIFDLVDYLNKNNIKYACAHPFFPNNDKLTFTEIEKLILLFKNWEWNGDLIPQMNQAMKNVIASLDKQKIEKLANKHNIFPSFSEPWKKNLLSGSDDHSSLNLARTYSEVRNAKNLEEFWNGIQEDQIKIFYHPSSPKKLARDVYGIAYQFYKSKFNLERKVSKDLLLCFMDRSLQSRISSNEPKISKFYQIAKRIKSRSKSNGNLTLFKLARDEAEKHIQKDRQLITIVKEGNKYNNDLNKTWFDFVNRISNNLFVHFETQILDRLLKADLFDIFHLAGSAGALYALLAPYFVGFSIYTGQRVWSTKILNYFSGSDQSWEYNNRNIRLAHFTDTFYDVNGVARTLQQKLASAIELNKDYNIITCSPKQGQFKKGVHNFEPISSFIMPEYPEQQLHFPPFLQILSHCYEEEFNHIHIATPGPVGLVGLAISRILKLPVSGTYHTAFPQYAKIFTDNSYVEDLLWKCMIWFYNQLDAVYSPSQATADELIEKGISRDKIRVYPRGVDIERFNPENQDENFFQNRFGILKDTFLISYVGRISKEKNLHLLTQAYKELLANGNKAVLVVTGDGPYRKEMENELKDTPALFTGYMEGKDLDTLYASVDCLVLPSTTDTFGNVVLEAQASGIPVIVTDQGGPSENVIDGETGFIVEANSSKDILRVILEMVENPYRCREMGAAARKYMETRSFRKAFNNLWDMYVNEECGREKQYHFNLPDLEAAAKVAVAV